MSEVFLIFRKRFCVGLKENWWPDISAHLHFSLTTACSSHPSSEVNLQGLFNPEADSPPFQLSLGSFKPPLTTKINQHSRNIANTNGEDAVYKSLKLILVLKMKSNMKGSTSTN